MPVTLNITIDMLDKLGVLAKDAGAEIMKIYNSDFKVETKADNSPVTNADQIAEAMITDYIKKNITDAFPIIGEEAVAAGTAPQLDGGPFWLIDALDGTKEFIKKSKEFTVNIALIDRNRPALGVVHAPALNATYWGSQMGCYAQTGGGEPRKSGARKPAADGLVVLVSKSHRTPEVDTYLSKLKIKKEVSAGSSLKFCRIATGNADIYPRLGRTMEWDTAAGHAVLFSAGGKVRDMNDQILPYGKPGFKNPNFVAFGAE
jgi:3'(2'), 5'-bisphosphate nucleotidase